ncbi:MAG: cellulase family glycosylhydrolase [Oligoflexia bacterium]|nr:cellulase family glycosylhydrolase [Oligoflexia bacterium]
MGAKHLLALGLTGLLVVSCTSDSFNRSPVKSTGNNPSPSPTITLSPTPTPSGSPSPSPSSTPAAGFEVGVCTHLDTSSKIQQIAQMGAKWIRIDMNWNIMEPNSGQWQFAIFDQVIDLALSKGLQVYASIGYTPAWAATNGKTDGSGLPQVDKWVRFVNTAVNRYKNKVRYFGIWNEPNLSGFWSGTADQFVDLVMQPAFDAIRAIDPTIKVLGPDLAHLYNATISMSDFYGAIQRKGCLSCFDIITHHIYAGTDFEQKVNGFYIGGILYKDGLKQILERVGLWGSPVWITELGVDAAQSSEAEQSARVVEQLRFLARQPWAKKAFIYELTDDPATGWNYGLIKIDGSPRPFYFDVKALIQNGFQ